MIRLKWIEKISQFIQQVVYHHVWLLENEMYLVGENDLERSTSSKIQKNHSLTLSLPFYELYNHLYVFYIIFRCSYT